MGPTPVEVGKEYNVEITELSRQGDGVAKIQGFVIFVQGAKVGQKVKIKVERVGPRFASASVVGATTAGASVMSYGRDRGYGGEEAGAVTEEAGAVTEEAGAVTEEEDFIMVLHL